VPAWAGPATARIGVPVGFAPGTGQVAIIESPSLRRPHPYVDPEHGSGWRDNDHRFFAWSAAVSALVTELSPDVVHAHDWHAAPVLASVPPSVRSVLTIHNLAHQGWCDPGWVDTLGSVGERFRWKNSVNALAGAISLADRIVTVSPRYAYEITTEEGGMGLDRLLASRGADLVGILNGIDTDDWNPSTDTVIAAQYDAASLDGKAACHDALCAELGLDPGPGPLVVGVSRFDYQKGIDLLAGLGPVMSGLPVRLAILGSGDWETERAMALLAESHPGRIAFRQGYDAALAHRIFAAGDLALIPSRFEPCGLTQMQAMRYGTVPIVSDVGGLHDTVIDADASPRSGTGIVLRSVDPAGVVDGLHRGARLAANRSRLGRVRARGMAIDWSWTVPAQRYLHLYECLITESETTPERV
jgi:starch synthase